jgi:hypothetical protein
MDVWHWITRSVPAGIYGIQTLQSLKPWKQVARKVAGAEDARGTGAGHVRRGATWHCLQNRRPRSRRRQDYRRIPGDTRTLPIAIYTLTQVPDREAAALRLVVNSILLSMIALVASELLGR